MVAADLATSIVFLGVGVGVSVSVSVDLYNIGGYRRELCSYSWIVAQGAKQPHSN